MIGNIEILFEEFIGGDYLKDTGREFSSGGR
jgi:hypothetical protein